MPEGMQQPAPVTEQANISNSFLKQSLLRHRKSLAIIGTVLVLAALAAGGYQWFYAKNEAGILDKFSVTVSKLELSEKEIVNLTNKNVASESLKDINSVDTFLKSVLENDNRIISALGEQENVLSQQSQILSGIKTPEIKKNTGLYLQQLQKYIGATRLEYLKLKEADQQYYDLLAPIKAGKLSNKEADSKIAEITTATQKHIKAIENYDTLELKKSYVDFATSVQTPYPELRNKFPQEAFTISGLTQSSDSLQRIKTGLMPSDNELTEAAKAAEELVNKLLKETKPLKRTYTTYDYWGYPSTSEYYLTVPPNYAKTPELLTKFLRPKWSKEEADDFASQLAFDSEAKVYHFPSITNKTFIANASSVSVEEKGINYGKIRVVPQKVGGFSDYDEWIMYTNFIDYTVQKDSAGWKVVKMEAK